jgi:hypothetical protein
MSIVYGPVPSRRLGQSLGVDPIPFKTCNYNCVYCQLGRTHPLTNRRQDFYPPEAILGEVAPIVTPASGAVVLAPDIPIADAVVEIIRRHPLREAELVEALERYTPGQVAETLAALQAGGQARRLVYRDQAYWEYPESRFA